MKSHWFVVPIACATLLASAGCEARAAQPMPDPTVVALAAELAAMRAEATARAAVTPTALATAVPAATPTLTPEQAVKPVLDATVLVETDKGTGSGVVLGAGGVVTSYHVVEGAARVTVRFADQRSAPAQVVRVDRRRDLALLAVPTTEAPVPLGDTEGLQPGAPLLAVGYPLSSVIGSRSASVTRGAFSGLWRSGDDTWFVQTDTAVNPGNSGGPLLDGQGRVVGLVTFGVPQAVGLNYAVGANEVRVFLASGDNPPPPPAPTATPLPSPRQLFFREFDAVLAVHEANRNRLGVAYPGFRAGRLTPAAFAAEVSYQVTAREGTRQEGANLWYRAAGEPALTNLVAEFVTSMDLSVSFVQMERALLARGAQRTDDLAWKQVETQGDVAAARFDTFKVRYAALRRG